MAVEFGFPVGRGVDRGGIIDPGNGDVFNKYMCGFGYDSANIVGKAGGIFKRNGGPVAVPKQDRAGQTKLADQSMQIDITFCVVKINRARDIIIPMRIRPSMATPFINEHRMFGGGGKLCREIAPHANGAQGLVQENDGGGIFHHIHRNDPLAGQADLVDGDIEILV